MNRPGGSGRVIVVGSVNVDLVVTVSHLPTPGETVIGGRYARHHGGKGGNQAVASARLGAATSFVGAIGDDDLGRSARQALVDEGIDVAELAAVGAEPTGVALILVDERGENSIAVAGGANASLTPEGVAASLGRLRPGPGDVVLVGHEIPTAAATAALRAARAGGARSILNPAPPDGLTDDTLALVDILTPNRGEATRLAGGSDDAADGADRVRARIARDGVVLVTLGADGAILIGPDGAVAIDAVPVVAIDTVGAGDTLNGALAAGLAHGFDIGTAATRAVAAASLAVTRAGAREGMPTAAELDTFIAAAESRRA